MKLMHQKANVNVYLLLYKNDQVLMHLRQNTGYDDGKWAFVAGKVEDNECASSALIREAHEESGIKVKKCDLLVSHVMHRKTDRENVDIFMSCTHWTNEIANKEPEKCGDLKFFDLPVNTVDYIDKAISYIKNKQFYSEYGWS